MKQAHAIWLLAGLAALCGTTVIAADMPERELGLLLGGGYVDGDMTGEGADNPHPILGARYGQRLGTNTNFFGDLTYTRSVEQSKAINDLHGPAIIISASGMAETGRILHHLKNNLGDRRNTILITSWMAPETLGRRLAEGAERVRIFGEEYPVEAQVVSLNGMSAHADQAFLVEYALATKATLRKTYLVHGEAEPATALKAKLAQAGIEDVHFPELGQAAEL